MATLEAQAKIDIRVVIADQNLIDLSNQRDDDVAENTTITDRAVDLAAATVKGILGSTVDGDDLIAVDYTIRLAVNRLVGKYSLTMSTGSNEDVLAIMQQLEAEARRRRQGKTAPQTETPATDFMKDMDARYPSSVWDGDG